MTIDAVGGVWRYAMELAMALGRRGIEVVFAGFGPQPSPAQRAEADRIGQLAWLDAPLDWMAEEASALRKVPELIAKLADDVEADLLHLNLPSQASGLTVSAPVLVVSHSCVVSWFRAVRNGPVPEHWTWQADLNRAGFASAHAVVAPSRSHAAMLKACYGPIQGLTVIHNGLEGAISAEPKQDFVFAAGRWWDDGKNGAVLDEAARHIVWPVKAAGATQGPNGRGFAFHHARALGEIAHGKVRQLMGEAAIVVSPSIYEPFGLVALEGARAQAALVLADIPTYRELWDGAAVFADPREPKAFAEAVNRLARHPAQRAELGRRAFARAQAYSSTTQCAAFSALYERLTAMAAALP
ncbi:glycosyltransferase family 4 protein [Rhodoligotrophos defluvii]|uniref:glycosyltransferase family 4 protein n=1 Tax=Rhodoligotrophos defluvii TaxID=2561934 RepID=UPI001EF088EA|nr:glycosyltransferase family 4 protein [Rhodoligotrophos defluvii]